jgi:acylphosphatase
MKAPITEIHVSVDGRVQGVGYREFVRSSADRFGVTGWVRNRNDGSVEARLRGTTEGVEAVIADMRRGPRFAEVATLRIEARPRNEDAWLGFEVRRTM